MKNKALHRQVCSAVKWLSQYIYLSATSNT